MVLRRVLSDEAFKLAFGFPRQCIGSGNEELAVGKRIDPNLSILWLLADNSLKLRRLVCRSR
ncbi:hypothetical protein CfE428DRAFT_6394 [Chthoniobacter flavus Ellin428]|uniref:Uncharacterized protein n=1 Tax=Chthoniobacter flavus Ellin428 TaxID=497964 RepID=B4DBV3_9BACT|nr:hypothetical protein CfE428DRAFT_6394 [Chthoniobacter flavus Ellin428]TCO83849.1 hypothetical protein EV701_1405 [Chthoniobacter flavus]